MRASELQKELRIGNYLLGKCVDELDERKEWWEQYQIKDAEDLMGVKDGWDERIPLTEEWLLKFGFDKKSWKSQGIVIECFYYEKNGIIIYLIARGFEIEVKHGDDQFNLFRVWNHVHQLQNLYFALCGEELELK